MLFWIDAITCVIFGVLVWRAIPETRPVHEERTGSFRDVLRDRLMVAFVVISFGYAWMYLQAFTTLPLALTGQGLPPSAYGVAMAVNGLLIVFVQPLTSRWLSRRDHSTVLAVGFAVVAAGFAVTALVSSTLGYALSVAVWTLGEIVTAGIPGAIVAGLAPAHLRGRYSGLYGVAWSAAALLAPLAGTHLLSHGRAVLWLVTGGVGVLVALAQLAVGPAIRRRAAR
jgi:predicted MFS family arabinose efflux permease